MKLPVFLKKDNCEILPPVVRGVRPKTFRYVWSPALSICHLESRVHNSHAKFVLIASRDLPRCDYSLIPSITVYVWDYHGSPPKHAGRVTLWSRNRTDDALSMTQSRDGNSAFTGLRFRLVVSIFNIQITLLITQWFGCELSLNIPISQQIVSCITNGE